MEEFISNILFFLYIYIFSSNFFNFSEIWWEKKNERDFIFNKAFHFFFFFEFYFKTVQAIKLPNRSNIFLSTKGYRPQKGSVQKTERVKTSLFIAIWLRSFFFFYTIFSRTRASFWGTGILFIYLFFIHLKSFFYLCFFSVQLDIQLICSYK